jgi:type IV pilus assembly protein PilQ
MRWVLLVVALQLAAPVVAAPRRIDVDLSRADIRNVLRLFAEVGHVNIVYGGGVSGRVTLRLRRVRWDRALAAILRVKGLAAVREGNVIRVAPREELARERQRQVRARERCRDAGPLYTSTIRLSYARAEELAPLLRAHLYSKRGAVTVDRRTNTLLIRDVRCP